MEQDIIKQLGKGPSSLIKEMLSNLGNEIEGLDEHCFYSYLLGA